MLRSRRRELVENAPCLGDITGRSQLRGSTSQRSLPDSMAFVRGNYIRILEGCNPQRFRLGRSAMFWRATAVRTKDCRAQAKTYRAPGIARRARTVMPRRSTRTSSSRRSALRPTGGSATRIT
jgi:hypothetical protein